MSEQIKHPINDLTAEHLMPAFMRRPVFSRYTPWFMAAAYIIIIGILAFTFHRIGDNDVETDFYWTYAPSAQNILNGSLTVDDYKGPGYPAVLAVGKLIIGDFFNAGIFISVFSAGLFILFTYLFLKNLFAPEIAFLAVCALMTNTAFIRYSYTASTDMPFAALMMIIIFLMFRKEHITNFDLIISGIVTGSAYLTRYNAVSIIIAACYVLLFLHRQGVPVFFRIKSFLLFCVSAFIIILPWMIYLHAVTGDPFYQKNYLNMAYEIYGKGIMGWDQWWAQEAPRFQSLIGVLSHDPIILVQRVFINLGEHFINDVFWLIGIWWGILAAGGMYLVVRRYLTRRQLVYFVLGGAYFLFLVPFFYSDRFSLPLVPFYIVAAIVFLSWITHQTIRYRGLKIGIFILFGLFVLSAYRTAVYNYQQISSGPQEVLEIADKFEAFKQIRSENGMVITARKPHIAYYLSMRFHPMPILKSADELYAYCRTNDIDYIFVSSVETKLRPELSTLLASEHQHRGFSPVVKTDAGDAILYEIEAEGME